MTADRITSFVDKGLGNSSYLIDLGDGRALVVDPVRDVSRYLEHAGARGLTIAFALETHLHADFISGSHALQAQGATVLAPKDAGLGFAHRGLADGEDIPLGAITIRALATPGHTPEHQSYLVLEDGVPAVLFSGGALLPGGAARTDLIAPEQTEPLTRALYSSLHDTIMALPDDVGVSPTHGGGSFCALPGTDERTTTIGRERVVNPLLAQPDEDSFVATLLGGLGTYPPYFRRLRPINQRGPALLPPHPAVETLSPARVLQLQQEGAALVDTRPVAAWAAGHISGSISIELRPEFATWLGWLVDHEQQIVFVHDDDDDAAAAAVRAAAAIGYDSIAGALPMDAWHASGEPIRATSSRPIDGGLEGIIVDVRQASEYAAGHIPSAVHLELGSIASGEPTLPPGPLTVHCAHGQRAASAASLLERAGRHDVRLAIGGPADWSRSTGHALTTEN